VGDGQKAEVVNVGSGTNGEGVGVQFIENGIFVEFFEYYRGVDASKNQ